MATSPCSDGQTYLNSERGAGAHDDARDEREDAGEAAVSHGEEGVKKEGTSDVDLLEGLMESSKGNESGF